MRKFLDEMGLENVYLFLDNLFRFPSRIKRDFQQKVNALNEFTRSLIESKGPGRIHQNQKEKHEFQPTNR